MAYFQEIIFKLMRKSVLIFGFLFLTIQFSIGQTADSTNKRIYSETANNKGQVDSATVYVTFIVDTTGKIINVEAYKIRCRKCKKELKENLRTEAVRIVKSMPDWGTPKQNVRYNLPLRFALREWQFD
jgi:hypothetical protein